MKYVLFLLCALTAVSIGGCGGLASFPNVPVVPAQVAGGGLQGNNYGGHAPLVGAHVFVLQPGTGGYGAKVSSLLGANETATDFYGSVYPTIQDAVLGSPTSGMYYVTTDYRGDFDIDGDYTCTAGYPVYLYASGGSPNTSPAVTVTGASSAVDANNKTLVTFSTNHQLLYQGESVTFGTFTTGGVYNSFSGTTQTVSSLNLTTGQFAVELGSNVGSLGTVSFTTTVTQNLNSAITLASMGATAGTGSYAGQTILTFTNTGTNGLSAGQQITLGALTGAYSGYSNLTLTVLAAGLSGTTFEAVYPLGASTTATQTFASPLPTAIVQPNNPAVVNMAVLGNCPTGTLNFSALQFVYVNEVSTVAAAYALAPFSSTLANNDAIHIGTSSTNLVGLQNAALNAANLYDIQGSLSGPGDDGETHIAYATTPTPAAGTVPQTLLNTLGNLLANCVDSANTYNTATASTGIASPQCSTLFANATSDGTTTGTKPSDTATAAINIAHFPAGGPSATAFASNLFNSITGNVPFQPTLSTAPHDFAVAIQYTTPGGYISDVEVDGSGNIWTVGNGSNAVYSLSPNGVFTTYSPPVGSLVTNTFISSLAIDSTSSNIYVPAVAGMLKFNPGNTTGTLVSPLNLISASGVAIDNSSNLYVANIFPTTNATEMLSYLQKESTAGVAAGAPFPIVSPCTYEMQYVTLDGSYNIWTSNQYQGNSPNYICRYSNTGTLQYSFAYPGAAFPLSYGLAIDAGGNAWFADKDNNVVYKIAAGTSTVGNTACNAAAGCTQATGGTVATPFSAAVDGANNVWFSNSVSGSLVAFGNNAVALTPTYLGGVSGYTPNVLSLMVDQSGSVWGNSYTQNTLVQYIGLAAPAAQPLSYARANNKLGARP